MQESLRTTNERVPQDKKRKLEYELSLGDLHVSSKLPLYAAPLYRTMRIRILLALSTGLRRGDTESLKISDISFTSNSIATMSRKTGKSMDARPVSKPIMTELLRYVSRYAANQERLFKDKFNSRQWKKICEDAKLKGLKFHDLRKTFCSILAQNGISTAVTQKLLEHS